MALFTPKNTSGYTIPTTGQVLYVAPNGTTANNGLSASTPTTLAKAYSLANSVKTTILMANGVYDDTLQISKPNITLQAIPGHQPTIDGADPITGWVLEGANYVKYGYDYDFPKSPTPDARDTTTDFSKAGNLYQLWLNEQYLDQVQNLSELALGKFYFEEGATPAQNKLMIRDNPAGKTVYGVARNIGIKIGPTNAANTIIKGLNVIRHAFCNIWGHTSPGMQIIDCVADYASYYGIQSDATGIVVRNCQANHCGKNGIKGGFWRDNQIIEDNEALYANKRRFNAAWGAASMKVMAGNKNTFRRNKFGMSRKCAGLWLDTDNFENEIYENEFIDSNIGLFSEIGYKAYIINNIFKNNNVAIMNTASEEAIIEFNDFDNNTTDIYLKDDNRVCPNDKHRYTAFNEAWVNRNNVIRNNYHRGTLQRVYECPTLPGILSNSYIAKLENNQFVNILNFAKWTGAVRDKIYATLAAFKTDYPTLQATSVELATAPSTGLASKPAHDANVLRILGGTLPPVVGAKITSVAPPPPPPYTPPTEAEYRAIMAQIDTMEGRIQTLEDEIYITELEVERLNGIVTTLTGQKTALQGQVTTLQGQVTPLQGQVTTLTGQKTALQGQVTTLQGQVTTLQGEISPLQAEIVRLNEVIANQPNRDAEVAELNAQIAALTDKLNQIRAILA